VGEKGLGAEKLPEKGKRAESRLDDGKEGKTEKVTFERTRKLHYGGSVGGLQLTTWKPGSCVASGEPLGIVGSNPAKPLFRYRGTRSKGGHDFPDGNARPRGWGEEGGKPGDATRYRGRHRGEEAG